MCDVLFSGRFDRPHLGHLETLLKLGNKYRKIIVVVLNYKEQMYPAQYRAQKLSDILKYCKGNYEVVVNNIHFAHITKGQLNQYKFDIYASGNIKCLMHVEQLGYKILYTPRSGEYNASDDRRFQQVKEIMNGTE